MKKLSTLTYPDWWWWGGGFVLNGEYKEEEKQTKVKFSFFRIIVTWNA